MAQIQDVDFVYVLDDGRIVKEGYRHSLEDALRQGPFSTEATSPTISIAPHFDFEVASRRALSKARNVGARPGSVDSWTSSVAVQDSIDMQLDSYADGLAYDTYPVSYGVHDSRCTEILRPRSPARAISIAIKRQSRRGTMLFPNNLGVFQDLDLLENTSIRIGAGGNRPMSMHQAIVMRSMYCQPSSRSRSETGAFMAEKSLPRLPTAVMLATAEAENSTKASITRILKTLWPSLNTKYRLWLLFGFVSVLVHAAGIPVFSYIFSQLLGTFFIKQGQAKKALVYSMAILGISILDAIACFLSWYLLEAVGESWIDKLRIDSMTRVLDQPKEWFDAEQNSVSAITSSLDRNAEEMRNLVGRFAGIVITVAVMMVIAITWSLITCWKVTLVGLTAGPVLYCLTKAYEIVASRWEARTNVASDTTEAIFVEAFSDIRTVRALTLESHFHKKYTRATSKALAIGVQRATYSGLFFGLSDSAVNFVTALIFWYSGTVVRSHDFSVKSTLTAFAMLLFSTGNAVSVIAFIPQISSSIDTASRLLRLARLPLRSSHEHTGSLKLNPQSHRAFSGPVRFTNLTFYYPSRAEVPALSNLNLTIPNGRCTAIVGASGSGKSTIAALLVGLYLPSTGPDNHTTFSHSGHLPSLTVFEHDICTLHLPTLRSMISLVPQTPTLFSASVRANIAYGLHLNSGLTSNDNIEHAAQRAGIHDFINSLPQSYETIIGEGGLGLSGGQAQRIVIARALCRRPKILILDEATSALDGESAWVVRQSILELVKEATGMTVIIITHAKDMMQCADNIVLLEQGRVAEEGGFRELLARKGKLWEMLKVGGVLTGTVQ